MIRCLWDRLCQSCGFKGRNELDMRSNLRLFKDNMDEHVCMNADGFSLMIGLTGNLTQNVVFY